INDYFGRLNKVGLPVTAGPIPAKAAAAIIAMTAAGTISSKIAKELADIVWREGGDPYQIVRQRGLEQVSDQAAIEKAIDTIVTANPEKAAEAKEKPKMIGWFVGQAMKATGGKANPELVNTVLKRRLSLPEEG